MQVPDPFKELHDSYLHHWMVAEEVLKMVERIQNELFIPSIKELRYAARREVDAHLEAAKNPVNEKQLRVHLIEAIENCRKARHDALDSAVNFVHEELDKLIDLAGLEVVAQGFPEYAALKVSLNEVSKHIVESRKTRERLDDKYEEIKREHIRQVVELYLKMETSVDVINAITKRRSSEFWKGVFLVGGVIGLVVGLIAGSAVAVMDKRGWFDFTAKTEAAEHSKEAPKPKP
jgi:hypothetical protein